MRVLVAGETELRLEVTLHVRGGGDGSEESGIDALLVGLSLLRSGVLLLGLLEDTFLGLLGGLVSLEVGVVDVLGDGDLGDVDNGGGGDDLVGDGSSDWDTVDLVWSGDEEKSRLELLQEDDSLASGGTGEEDEDGSWDDGGSKGVLVLGEGFLSVSDELLSEGKSWVELGLTSGNDLSLAAVLLASDRLGGDESSLLGLDLGHWLGALVLSSSRVHLRSRVLGDAIDGAVTGHFELKSPYKKSESSKS